MRIEIAVELSERVEPENRSETRRFSREVEMDLPGLGDEIELNVAGEPVFVIVTNVAPGEEDAPSHVTVRSDSLTFKSLREDERWDEKLL
jgi:hypothetical protein